jgi:SAM-dependent methyltransferase
MTTVSFEYAPLDRVDFARCFRFPPRYGEIPRGPVRLDYGHLWILEQLPKGSSILDIGCGGGQMREFVRAMGHTYTGTDISADRVESKLLEFGGPDIICDAHELPLASGAYDAVYSAAVMEHIACPVLVAQQISRVLKPGGFYLGGASFLEPWHDESYFHMSPLGVYQTLKQANLQPEFIWADAAYSGYYALMKMGNKATRPAAFIGSLISRLYFAGNTVRRLVKRKGDLISEAARVAGGIDWIARKP